MNSAAVKIVLGEEEEEEYEKEKEKENSNNEKLILKEV